MNRKNYLNKYKFFLMGMLFCCITFAYGNIAILNTPQKTKTDQASIQWDNRSDVKQAVKSLQEVNEQWENLVRKIYNTCAPYTIGEDKISRSRFKKLVRFLVLSENIEGIYTTYLYSIGSSLPHQKNMSSLKKAIIFYYFDQEMKARLGWNTKIISQLDLILEDFFDPQKYPDFERVTKFNKAEANALLVKIDAAIHAAMATIPGGTNALKQ